MIYADFEYYRDIYGGTLVLENDFHGLAVKASAYLNYITMGKAERNADLDALKLACCALVDKYSEIESMALKARESACDVVSGSKKSESVGSHSVTYQSAEERAKYAKDYSDQLKSELPGIVGMYLAGTNLMYRGGGCKCTLPTL